MAGPWSWRVLVGCVWAASGCSAPPPPSGFAALLVEPASIELPVTPLGIVQTATVTLRSTGPQAASVRATLVSGEGVTDDPAITLEGLPGTIPAGGAQTVTVRFEPTRAGGRTARFRFEGDALRPAELAVRGVTGGAGPLVVEPQTFDFGAVLVDERRELPMRLQNSGESPMQAALELPPGVSECDVPSTTFCVESGGRLVRGRLALGPGESVVLRWVYRPLNVREVDAETISVRGCVGERCEAGTVISLRGRSLRTSFVCGPAALEFGLVAVGACAERILTCQNLSTSPRRIVSAAVEPRLGFSVLTSLPVEGAANAALEFPVRYCPPGAGSDVATLRLRVDEPAPSVGFVEVALRGAGGGALLAIEPAALDFGRVAAGVPVRRRFILTNRGVDPTSEFQLSLSSELEIVGTPPSVLRPGARVPLDLELRTSVEGPFVGELALSGPPESPPQRVPVAAQVVGLGPCVYAIRPPAIDFGVIGPGTVRRRVVVIDNVGTEPCLVTGARWSASSAPVFSLGEPVEGREIPAEETLRVPIDLTPTSTGTPSGVLELGLSSPEAPAVEVPVTAQVEEPRLGVWPTRLDFGTTGALCRPRTRRLTFYNPGMARVLVDGSAIVGPSTTFRSPSGLPAGNAIPAGGRLAVTMQFDPTTEGTYESALELTAGPTSRPQRFIVPLSGRARPGAVPSDVFEQSGDGPVDVLWVFDASNALTREAAKVARNATAFIDSAVNSGRDFHVSVTSDDRAGPFEVGLFKPYLGRAPRVVTPNTLPSPADVFLANATLDAPVSSWPTFGLASAALQFPLLEKGNAGFLREDARLTVILVSANNDSSIPTTDATELIENLWALKERPQDVHTISIVPEGCPGVMPGPYPELTRRGGGALVRFCDADWSRALDAVSGQSFGRRSSFPLSLDPDAIRVAVDGVVVPESDLQGVSQWSVTRDPPLLTFTAAATPPPGAEIRVEYRNACP